ncbi:MAG: thioredoxin family protein [Patescibacteria group bacterium]
MIIQVLGSGCPTCHKLFAITKEVVSALGLSTHVEYITDVQKIVAMGVLSSPVLAIDGKPVLVGLSPNKEQVTAIIKKHIG